MNEWRQPMGIVKAQVSELKQQNEENTKNMKNSKGKDDSTSKYTMN